MLKKMKFQHKLFFWFALLLIVFLTAFAIVFYWYTGSMLRANVSETQMRTVRILREKMDGLLSDMDRVAIATNSSEHMMDILMAIPPNTGGRYFDDQVRINDKVKDLFYSFIAPDSITGRTTLITRNYDYTGLSNKFRSKLVSAPYIRNIPWVQEAMGSSAYKIFMPPHPDDWSEDGNPVVSVARPLRDNYKNVYGLVEVSRDVADLDAICRMDGQESALNVALFDAFGKQIYSCFGSFDEAFLKEGLNLPYHAEPTQTEGSYLMEIPGQGDYAASFSRLENVDWTVVLFESMQTYQRPIVFIRNVVMVSYVLVFLLVLVVIYLITGSLSKPIRQLTQSVSSVDRQTLQLKVAQPSTNDELLLLTDTFQDLLSEIQARTADKVESHKREMKAHMLVWQAQINPHFLYNTLAVIGAYGQKNGSPEVAEMCADLSNMQRYVLDAGESAATIRSEIEHGERYLNLMHRRYGANFNFEIALDENLASIPIPKLLLQPLLENSFSHGFQEVEPPWELAIRVSAENGNWYIRVEDNGVGFSPAALETLRKIDASETEARKYMDDIQIGGLGLVNTFMRLQLFCEHKHVILAENAATGGAVIVLGGPIPGAAREETDEHV